MYLKIYQIDMEKDEEGAKFCSFSEIKKDNGKINPSIYEKVFDGMVNCENNEDVYRKFNTDIPASHTGCSLAVSDIIEAEGEFFFCDVLGFKKVEFDTSKIEQEDMLRVLVVEPYKKPYEANIIDDYKTFQKIVRGTITCTYEDHNSVIYCNDEAKLIGLEGNRMINGDIIAGTFVITGDDHNGGSISLTDKQIEKYKARFDQLEAYTTEEVAETCVMKIIAF